MIDGFAICKPSDRIVVRGRRWKFAWLRTRLDMCNAIRPTATRQLYSYLL